MSASRPARRTSPCSRCSGRRSRPERIGSRRAPTPGGGSIGHGVAESGYSSAWCRGSRGSSCVGWERGEGPWLSVVHGSGRVRVACGRRRRGACDRRARLRGPADRDAGARGGGAGGAPLRRVACDRPARHDRGSTDLSRRALARGPARFSEGRARRMSPRRGSFARRRFPAGRAQVHRFVRGGSFEPAAMPVTQWLNDSVPRSICPRTDGGSRVAHPSGEQVRSAMGRLPATGPSSFRRPSTAPGVGSLSRNGRAACAGGYSSIGRRPKRAGVGRSPGTDVGSPSAMPAGCCWRARLGGEPVSAGTRVPRAGWWFPAAAASGG